MKRYLTFFLSILLLMECVPFKAQAQTGIRNHRKGKTAAQPNNEAPVYEITLNSRDWSIERIRLYSRNLGIERKLGPYLNIVRKYQDKDPTFYRLVVTAGQKKYTAPFRIFKEFIVEDFSGESPRLIQIENVADEKPTVSVPTDSLLQGEIVVSVIDNKGRVAARRTFRAASDGFTDIHNKEIAFLSEKFRKVAACGDLKEVIPGSNHPVENRINIIFSGHGYKSVDKFASHLPEFVDYDGTGWLTEIIIPSFADESGGYTQSIKVDGLLGEEPFKSNKQLFNFWYVDKAFSSTTPLYFDFLAKDHEVRCHEFVSDDASYAYGQCLPNIFRVRFMNENCRAAAYFGGDVFVDFKPNPDQFNQLKPKSIRTVIHELGHSIGYLRDEYLEEGKGSQPGFPNCISDSDDAVTFGWEHQGYQGCSYTSDNIRPTENSIMRALDGTDFDYLNERYLCLEIFNKTGHLSQISSCLEIHLPSLPVSEAISP